MSTVGPHSLHRRFFILACHCVLAFASSASAEPMSLQGAVAAVQQPRISGLQPYYDGGLERPLDDDRWRIGYSPEDRDEPPEIPTGIIASFGSFGLRIDTAGDGPAVAGLAWTPNPLVSVVAGGSLGGGGIGASLSVRLKF